MYQSLILTLSLASVAIGKNLKISKHQNTDCWEGCTGPLTSLTFGDAPAEGSYYTKLAGSTYVLTSIYGCLEHYCESHAEQWQGAEEEWEEYIGYAWEYGSEAVLPTMEEIEAKMPARESIPFLDVYKSIAAAEVINSTVIPIQESYDFYMRTIDTWNQEEYYHQTFGYCLYLLLSLMVIVGLMTRFFAWLSYETVKLSGKTSLRSEIAPSSSVFTKAQTVYQKYLGTPALFGHKHATPAYHYFSIPTRLQALFIFAYIFLNVFFCSYGYILFEENQYWPGDLNSQLWRYIADRTGIICFWNLPLLWLFAGRNDCLLWITGWSFSQINLMHRWVARIATLQAIVHSIGYIWLERKRLASEWTELYWRCGIFALAFMVALIPLSMLPLRKYQYEIFLIVHILFAAVILPLLWYHVEIFEGQYAPFLYACIGVWAFDRLARWVRLCVLSYNAFKSENAVAVVTGNENGLIRLSVDTPFKISPKAGQYFFLYHPKSLTPWENHPFTLASWEEIEYGKSTRLHFLIAVQSGATRRLSKRLNQDDSPTNMKVLLEGPYGHSEPVERYEHVLFVAGGSGITAILPYVHQLKTHAFTRSVRVIWSVKNNAYASDVFSNELRGCGAEVILHVTEEDQRATTTINSGDQALEHTSEKGVKAEDQSSESGGNRTVLIGRPVMEDIVNDHVNRLVGSERMAIVACGPGPMVDDMRRAVANVYGGKEGQVNGCAIDYYEEMFSW